MQAYFTSSNNKLAEVIVFMLLLGWSRFTHLQAKSKSLFLPRSQALLNHNIEHLVDIESIERLEFYYVS